MISCPVCKKEITGTTQSCMHCSYQAEHCEEMPDIPEVLTRIESYLKSFILNPAPFSKNIKVIFYEVFLQVDHIRKKGEELSAIGLIKLEDEIAIMIAELISVARHYAGWPEIQSYYELVDFESISDHAMSVVANKIIKELKKMESVAMYSTVCICPIAIRISRLNFWVLPGHIFLLEMEEFHGYLRSF